MDAIEYMAGLALVGAVVGGFWLTARRLRRLLVPGWSGAPAALGEVVLALSLVVVTSELLGLVGLLNAPALAICALAPAAALARYRVGAAGGASPRGRLPTPAAAGRLGLGLAVAVAVLVAVQWAGPVLRSLDVGMYRQDSLWYHLPLSAWIAQTGSVGGLLLTDPLKVTAWFYPLNSELIHANGMVLLGNDLLSPTLNFAWLCMAMLGAWCIGRPAGVAPATLLASSLVLGSDMMLVQAGNAPSDIFALGALLAALAILVNGQAAAAAGEGAAESGGRPRIEPGPLALAALAAGLAVGAKVTLLVPVAVISVWVFRAEVVGGARRAAAIWFGGVLATGGFWYLRNLVHSGNPLPWIQFGPLPGPDQLSLYPRPPHSMVGYLADRDVWTSYFFPGLEQSFGPLWFVVVFAAVAGIVLGLNRRNSSLVRTFAVAAAAVLAAHVFNPISAPGPDGAPYGFYSNLRYAAPGLAIGLILLPLCEPRRLVRLALMPCFAALAVVAALASAEWVQPNLLAAIVLGVGVVLIPVWLLRRPAAPRGWIVAALFAAAVLAAGYAQQRTYFERRYDVNVAPPLDNPGFRATPQWQTIQTWARNQHNLRIGIVGTPAAYGEYIFYGDDLSNTVRYLGEPRPHGGLRPIVGCRRWRALVNAGRFDAVVITPEELGSTFAPAPTTWTAVGETAKPILDVPPAAVFALTGPLDPRQCGSKLHGSFSPMNIGRPQRFGPDVGAGPPPGLGSGP
jgi:hypothetical protein